MARLRRTTKALLTVLVLGVMATGTSAARLPIDLRLRVPATRQVSDPPGRTSPGRDETHTSAFSTSALLNMIVIIVSLRSASA